MKLLWILCVALAAISSVAQTTTGAASDSKRDKYKEPKLDDFRVDVDSEGRFKSPTGTPKQMSTLKVSDLPSPNDPPLDIATTVKVHRSRAMEKMQARSLPDLVRMMEQLKGTSETAS